MKHAIPNDWDHETFCRFAICWPDSTQWRALLRGLVTEPARGFFWDENTGWIKDVLADFRQTMDQNIELPEVFMACNDENIANALSAIAQAIVTASANAAASANATANACCEQTMINQGGGSVGLVIQPGTGQPVPIYGSQAPIVLPPGTYPDGYESQEEYDLDKCQVANLIIDGWIDTIRTLGAITTFNTIALAGLIVASVVTTLIFPPSAIPIAVGALIVISGATGMIAGLVLGLEERRQDLVCILYQGDTVDSIIGSIADTLDLIIAAIPVGGAIAVALKTLALVFINSDTLNQLFKKQAHLNYPDADCSNCGPCELEWTEEGGTGDLTPDGQERTLNSVLNTATNRHTLYFFGDCECSGGQNWYVEVVSMDGYIPNSGGGQGTGDTGGAIADCEEQGYLWSYGESVAPIGTWCAHQFALGAQAEQSFSAVVRIWDTCPE